ncbi:unnamed protein product [Alopecurus aequalis]
MGEVEAAVEGVGDLGGGQAAAVVGVGGQDDGRAAAGLLAMDGIQYCSEHPYKPGAPAAAGGGICAFCLQEKLGMLVSSSKSSPFFPPGGHPPPCASPPSFRRAAEPAPPLPSSARSRKFTPFGRKKTSASSSSSSSASATLSASMSGGGLKRSKSVAPRPEEQHFSPFATSSVTAESPRKKSFWSFLYLTSSSSYAHQAASTASYGSGGAAARRKSVSVASAAWASRGGAALEQDQQPRSGTSAASGRRMEAIGEPESPSQSQVSSSSSFGRKVARSRSVGCGSRSFSGDFLERISFGDCTLRRVESQREPKTNRMRGHGHLRGAAAADEDEDGDVYEHGHRIKCAGFFGGIGPTSSSTYWLSAAEGAASGGCTRKPGSRSHRGWAWALASPMRALRPTSSTSTKIITAEPSSHSNGSTPAAALSVSSPMPSSLDAAAAATTS